MHNDIESSFGELTPTTVQRYHCNRINLHLRSGDIITEKNSVALEPIVSSLDPLVKTYIMGDFYINLLDHILSAPVETLINQMILKKSQSLLALLE